MKNELINTTWQPPISEEALQASYTAIQGMLQKNEKGAVMNTLQNCSIALEHDPILAGNIRRNLFTEKMDIRCPLPWTRRSTAIDDIDLSFILLHLESNYSLKSEKQIMHALRIASTKQAFHPVQEKLRSLQWDGVSRIREALHHFLGADISDFNEHCLRVFMLGAVKRVFHPGCKFELMLVLVGGQGAGKTTFTRFLAMEDEWFTDDVRNLSDEKVFHHLNGHWIVELSEMVATANAKSIEEIKSFLSRDKDNCRLAYDRFGADHPRQCVFAGTTNRTDFLPMDRSGNRRFLPIMVHPEHADCHILDDPEASRTYFEQMWAEIMVQFDSGEYVAHLSKEDEKILSQIQGDYEQEDVLVGRIIAYLDTLADDKVCTMQIYSEGLGHLDNDPKSFQLRDIRQIMDAGIEKGSITGWEKCKSPRYFAKYGSQRCWVRVRNTQPVDSAKELEQTRFTYIQDDPDCPF